MIMLEQILPILAPNMRPLMLTQFRRDCCVATCRTLLQVFEHFEIKAEVLPVRVTIKSERAGRFIDLGAAEESDYFKTAGHFVVLLPRRRLFIDASISQVNKRPGKREVHLPDFLVVPISMAAISFEHGIGRLQSEVADCVVTYQAFPKERGYLVSPDWVKLERTQPIAEFLIKAIEQKLKK